MYRAERFAVWRAAFTAAVLVVIALPVAAQKPVPLPSVKAVIAPMPKPLPSPVIVINNVPAAPVATKFVWWKDFPWTALASIGVIGAALIARGTSERKRVSDEKLADDRLKNERDLAEARQKQERELAELRQTQERELSDLRLQQDHALSNKRQEQERAHFRSKELQDQFGDIQNRLASTEPIIRANAALRLAQFGETLKPGVENSAPRTKENNPYFIPVISQLSTALYLESNPVIRKSIREALKNLITFANTDGDDQPLLHSLIERLADANRTARDGFIRAFAEWSVTDEDWQTLQNATESDLEIEVGEDQETRGELLQCRIFGFLSSVAPFCQDQKMTRVAITRLMIWGEQKDWNDEIKRESLFAVQQRKHTQKRKAQADVVERAKGDALLLPSLDTAAQQLIDTRDALTEALQAICIMQDLTLPPPLWKRGDTLNLAGSFLCGGKIRNASLKGVNLRSAHLEGATLIYTHLEGANLIGAYLDGANLKFAHLEGAYLISAHLNRTILSSAHLEGADFGGAHMERATLTSSHLEGANLSETHLEMANLSEAHLEGANLSKAHLNGANLYGVYTREDETSEGRATCFPEDTLDLAIFKSRYPMLQSIASRASAAVADARTARLKEWLALQRIQKEADQSFITQSQQ